MADFPTSSILLTYKGKILLSSPDVPSTNMPEYLWSLIGGKKVDKESFEETVCRKIKYTTKLEIKNIQCFSSDSISDKRYYHGELSDRDVNIMERREGLKLEFFTLDEAKKLNLSEEAEVFLDEYKASVEDLFNQQ